MLDTEQMLIHNPFIPNTEGGIEEYTLGYSAFEVGGNWNALGSSEARRWGQAGNITSDGDEYLVLEHQIEHEKVRQDGEPDTGETGIEAISAGGLSAGFALLPAESSTLFAPTGIYSLGSGFYIANAGVKGLVTGGAYRLSAGNPPESTELDMPLGTEMTGFLLSGGPEPGGGPEATGPGESSSGGSPAGSPKNEGGAGGLTKLFGPVVKAIELAGSASAKLKGGVIKLDVTCGLPCAISGAVLPPGAKAASADKSKALPFKSVRLAGTGNPVVVRLRFTPAQKKLAGALLSKHKKVVAKITVTEGPGGAQPESRSIRIT